MLHWIPSLNFAESVVDNIFRDKVEPVQGSVLYCDLLFGYAEHSGIYIGNDEIVHLNKHGEIEIVSPEEFIDGTTAISIYVSCKGNEAVGDEDVAELAEDMVGEEKDYQWLMNNCHQFTAGCVIGDFENANNFLVFLKEVSREYLGADNWRVWDR